MKKTLLIVGICVCGLLALAQVWGLVFLDFSVRQTIYAVALGCTAIGMFGALRSQRAP